MSLADLARHNVDIVQVDDSGTGRRGGIVQAPTTLATAVPCTVVDIRSVRVSPHMRDQMESTHVVKFPQPIKLNGGPAKLDSTHRLVWTDPTDGHVVNLMVTGFMRPQSENMPWLAQAKEITD